MICSNGFVGLLSCCNIIGAGVQCVHCNHDMCLNRKAWLVLCRCATADPPNKLKRLHVSRNTVAGWSQFGFLSPALRGHVTNKRSQEGTHRNHSSRAVRSLCGDCVSYLQKYPRYKSEMTSRLNQNIFPLQICWQREKQGTAGPSGVSFSGGPMFASAVSVA